MSLSNKLNTIYKRHQFFPEGITALLLNPFYLSRRGLLNALKIHSRKLDGKLLDFGCGAKPYKELFGVDLYVGLDIENPGHSHENENVDVYYNGNEIPFADASFDSVFSSQVFEHVFDLEKILIEINRVMREGGKLLITVPFCWNEHEVPNDFGRYTRYGVKHLLEKNGFEPLAIDQSGNAIEVIVQLWIVYLTEVFRSKSKYTNLLINLLLISPLNFLGAVFSALLPLNNNLYFDNIVLARKR